jgi:hypothetical protein
MQYYGFCIPKLPHDTYTIDAAKLRDPGLPKQIVLSWRGPVGETAAWLKDKKPADKKAAYKVCTSPSESRQLQCAGIHRMLLNYCPECLCLPSLWTRTDAIIVYKRRQGAF